MLAGDYCKNKPIKLATVDEGKERYRMSRYMLMKIAKEHDAVRHFGKSVRIDVTKLDKAIEMY